MAKKKLYIPPIVLDAADVILDAWFLDDDSLKRKENIYLPVDGENTSTFTLSVDNGEIRHRIDRIKEGQFAVEDIKRIKYEFLISLLDAAFHFNKPIENPTILK